MTARIISLNTGYTPHLVEHVQPDPAPRHWYMDSIAIQLGVGAIAICWFIGFMSIATIAYGVDAVLGLGQRRGG